MMGVKSYALFFYKIKIVNTKFENIKIRLADIQDNQQILDLVKKYPTSSSLSYVVDRSPSYFNLARLQGYDYKALVIEANNKILGSLLITFDKVYLEKEIKNIAYTSDLRVEPFIRKTGLADELMKEGIKLIKENLEEKNIFTCVLKDNIAGLKKNQNLARDGYADMKIIASLKTYFIFPFYTKKLINKDFDIRFANHNDLEEMFYLWKETNSNKNLSRAFTINSFKEWVNDKNGIGIDNYLLAKKNNKIVGFIGLWNQSKLRKVIIHSQNNQMRLFKNFWNLGTKLIKIPQFPASGQELNFYNITNLCIKDSECFEQLLYNAFKNVKRNNSMFLALALDINDELNEKLKYFIASTTELYLLSNYQFKDNNNLFHIEISLG